MTNPAPIAIGRGEVAKDRIAGSGARLLAGGVLRQDEIMGIKGSLF
ncbi:MAG: hypothetical protein QM764_07610 [Chitinophagaceae bacterium]